MSAPGWYPDPSGAPSRRYFDGTRWTDQYAPLPQAGPPARKSRVWLWVLLSVVGVLVLGFGGCVAFVGSVASNMDEGNGSSSRTTVTLGQAARDGKFEFRVTNVVPAAGERALLPTPRGTWYIATVSVANIGNEPQSFFVGNQKLVDAQGREYAADDMAAMRINVDAMVLDLGPGFELTVRIPFDIPAGSAPAALELHDSAFSGGVKVSI